MAFAVEQTPSGDWAVFWLERGNKVDLAVFDSEEKACFHLLGQLTHSQLIAGALPTGKSN